ncbi:MAG: AAA domain-containing protein [Pseudomonadota bacterium]|nr:AAA domain-containing protein [Pseudomonadota bacterium]
MWSDEEYPSSRYYYARDSDEGNYEAQFDTDETDNLLIARPKKAAGEAEDLYQSGSFIFNGIVLNWDISDIIHDKLKLISRADKLPDSYPSYSSRTMHAYYDGFIPFVLEEARATIAAGIESTTNGSAITVNFKIHKDVRFARNAKNTSKIEVDAELLADCEGRSKVAVWLQPLGQGNRFNMLGLASEHAFGNNNKKKTIIKFIINEENQAQYGREFKEGSSWRAHILGSVLSHERIYEACTLKPELTFLPQVVRGVTSELPKTYSPPCKDLNPSQQLAIAGFARAADGLYLLQGPPGTGKTTTIVDLIYSLVQQKNRVLICAPSNKAIQVIAERFYAKFKDKDIAIILAGVESKLPDALQPIFLHTWKNQLIAHLKKLSAIAIQPEFMIERKNDGHASLFIKAKIADFSAIYIPITNRLKCYRIDTHFQKLNGLLTQIENYLNSLRAEDNNFWINVLQCKHDNEIMPGKRHTHYNATQKILEQTLGVLIATIKSDKDLEEALLANAQVLFSTLSVAGRKQMRKTAKADVLIVDEAGQTVEAEILIPFILQPKKCLLVGDTKQLPATVISQPGDKLGYGRSMMHRLLEDCRQPHHMLNTQYRMHASIRQWPSYQFYNNNILDGPNIPNRTSPFPTLNSRLHQPYVFIDTNGKEGPAGNSYSNKIEATLIVNFVDYLQRQHKIKSDVHIGIISFYAGQVALIRQKLQAKNLKPRINSVDGFQGDENDIIIISFVRSNANNTVGFLRDFRRLNVAITRGRHAVIMFGNTETLSADHNLRGLLYHMRVRKLIIPQQEFEQSITATSAITASAPAPAPAKKIEPPKPPHKKPMQTQSVPANYKTSLCRHHQAGKCGQGDKCQFAHGKDDLKKFKKAKPPKPTASTQPATAHTASQRPVTGPKQFCRFFAAGNCKKGEACNNAHLPAPK